MRIFHVDTFTHQRFCGNPATVVLGADSEPDATLESIAREYSHAEVAFVSAATAADHDVRVRFFNTRKEAPFVGHATVAAHAVLLAVGRRGRGTCRQLSGTGIVDVRIPEEDPVMIEFRQSVPELAAPQPLTATLRVAEALRLPATQLHEAMPARIARKGSTRLLVPVAQPAALDTLAPNFDTLMTLGQELGAEGFFVFAVEAGESQRDPDRGGPNLDGPGWRRPTDLSTHARMFCPALGIPEDPVSGNAHAMLAAYLWTLGQFRSGAASFVGRQGRQMHRPGEVSVSLEVEHGALRAVRIAGGAVILSEGTLNL